MGRIALSISHEDEFAVAIAYGVRTAAGRYVFPPDIDARIHERERALLARLERVRALATDLRTAETDAAMPDAAMPDAAMPDATREEVGR
jgi:hypothetical protein